MFALPKEFFRKQLKLLSLLIIFKQAINILIIFNISSIQNVLKMNFKYFNFTNHFILTLYF